MECTEDKIVSPTKSSTPSPAQDEFSSAEGAIKYSNEIENIREESFGARSDTSLHEKISSIESALPQCQKTGKGDGWKLMYFVFLGMTGCVGFSIGVRNFGLVAGTVFAVMIMLFCAWILWPKTLHEIFRSKHKDNKKKQN